MKDNGIVLVTLLGQGRPKRDAVDNVPRYEDAKYQFAGDVTVTEKHIVKAALKANIWNIKKVVVFGTGTSGWDNLIDDSENIDLFLEVNAEVQSDLGLSDGKKEEIRLELEKMYPSVSFELHTHSNDVSGKGLTDIYELYYEVMDKVKGEALLLDVTYGLRPLSLMLFQVVHLFRDTYPSVHVIYDNLQDKNCTVLDIDELWQMPLVSEYKNKFEDRLDGKDLARLLTDHWRDGANWIRRFSKLISSNYIMQLNKEIDELGSILRNYTGDDSIAWVKEIHAILTEIYEKLNSNKLYMKYFNAANLFNSKKLETQAIIALESALETATLMTMAALDERISDNAYYVGDYTVWNGFGGHRKGVKIIPECTGKDFLKHHILSNPDNQTLNSDINKLISMRNRIAHANGEVWDEPFNEKLKINFYGYKNAVYKAIQELEKLQEKK